jgi:hypothetical protein
MHPTAAQLPLDIDSAMKLAMPANITDSYYFRLIISIVILIISAICLSITWCCLCCCAFPICANKRNDRRTIAIPPSILKRTYVTFLFILFVGFGA